MARSSRVFVRPCCPCPQVKRLRFGMVSLGAGEIHLIVEADSENTVNRILPVFSIRSTALS